MQDIRPAEAADLAAITRIVRDAYAPYVARIGREPAPMRDDYPALIVAGQVHVLTRAGVVEGVLVLIAQHDALLLDNIAVAPAAHGTGAGRALLEFTERAARAAGFDRVRLYTNEAMTENLGLYRRIGYVETHRAVEQGLRRVYMLKRLPAG
jgi:ribosomal protein S18 acetylase RimI-like enzyme